MLNKKYWIFGIVGLIILFIISGMNTIPTLDEKVSASWAQVQNQYQRRMDLIPNLVKTVKGYAAHESSTLEAVINARANATKVTISADNLSDPATIAKFEQAQGQLSSALSRLLAVSENYPNLKADQNFMALQSQLEGTENRITVARMDYIQTVQQYNTTIRTFPGIIWAKIYGAAVKANFTAASGAEKVPDVQF
jgi:LemA protein